MKAVIIDDESDARKSVKYYIGNHLSSCVVVGEADGVDTGIHAILDHQPDVVFLDINLGNGTGFDILNQLTERNFHLVFITGYDEYAIKAFKYAAIDYILKPIDSDDFALLDQKLTKQQKTIDIQKRLELLEHQLSTNILNKIVLPHQDGSQYVQLVDIIRLEADGNYTIVQLTNLKKIVVTKLLKEFVEILDEDNFFRTHKSHIINIEHVDKYNKSEEMVILKDGTEIPLARRRKKELLEKLRTLV